MFIFLLITVTFFPSHFARKHSKMRVRVVSCWRGIKIMNFHPIIFPPFYYARERKRLKCLRRAFSCYDVVEVVVRRWEKKKIYFVYGACVLGTLRAYSNESHVIATLIYLNCEYKLSWHIREQKKLNLQVFFYLQPSN